MSAVTGIDCYAVGRSDFKEDQSFSSMDEQVGSSIPLKAEAAAGFGAIDLVLEALLVGGYFFGRRSRLQPRLATYINMMKPHWVT